MLAKKHYCRASFIQSCQFRPESTLHLVCIPVSRLYAMPRQWVCLCHLLPVGLESPAERLALVAAHHAELNFSPTGLTGFDA